MWPKGPKVLEHVSLEYHRQTGRGLPHERRDALLPQKKDCTCSAESHCGWSLYFAGGPFYCGCGEQLAFDPPADFNGTEKTWNAGGSHRRRRFISEPTKEQEKEELAAQSEEHPSYEPRKNRSNGSTIATQHGRLYLTCALCERKSHSSTHVLAGSCVCVCVSFTFCQSLSGRGTHPPKITDSVLQHQSQNAS